MLYFSVIWVYSEIYMIITEIWLQTEITYLGILLTSESCQATPYCHARPFKLCCTVRQDWLMQRAPFWQVTLSCNNYMKTSAKKKRGKISISREAGECFLGWSSPPCDRSDLTTSVFLLRPASAFPCFRKFSFSLNFWNISKQIIRRLWIYLQD